MIRTTHPDGKVALRALNPQRLPATAPLAKVILDNPIWIGTEDGTIYPAPETPTAGTSWGYPGGAGPATFALLIDGLLDDITAQAPSAITGAPEGLDQLHPGRLPGRHRATPCTA